MKLNEVDNLLEADILKALGLIGGAYAGSQLRRAVNDRLPTYKKGGLRRSTSQICRKVNGRQVCDYGANVGFDLPTIEPPRASGGDSRGRQPTIDIFNFSTARDRNNNNDTKRSPTPTPQSYQQQNNVDDLDSTDPLAKLPPWLRPKKR